VLRVVVAFCVADEVDFSGCHCAFFLSSFFWKKNGKKEECEGLDLKGMFCINSANLTK
jgi:hypothetical protein